MPAKALLLPAFLLAEQAYSREACYMPRQGQKPPRAAEGFNWIVRSCLLCALLRGLQNLEALLKKVLIVEVRSCGCGALNRGLENLDVPGKGNGFILFACTKRTKSTPEVCEPLDSGDDSNRRSIRCFCENDRHSSGNRLCGKLQRCGVSPAMI